jgi:hypothetical protein
MVSMISHKTVLILGAGASRPYLFPTGGELRDLLLQRSYDSILRSLDLSGPDQQPYGDWYRQLLSNHIRQNRSKTFKGDSPSLNSSRLTAFLRSIQSLTTPAGL